MAWFERRRGAAAAWQVQDCCARLIPCFCLLLIKTAVWLCAASHAGRCMEVLLAKSAEQQVMACSCPVGAELLLYHCLSSADEHLAVHPHMSTYVLEHNLKHLSIYIRANSRLKHCLLKRMPARLECKTQCRLLQEPILQAAHDAMVRQHSLVPAGRSMEHGCRASGALSGFWQ